MGNPAFLFGISNMGTIIPTSVLRELPSNIGRYNWDVFAVVLEFPINVGYQVTKQLRVFVGYTFLYASKVLRPGDQIDRVVNTTQIPPPLAAGTLIGPARPAFHFKDTDFWAQGINFGLEFRF